MYDGVNQVAAGSACTGHMSIMNTLIIVQQMKTASQIGIAKGWLQRERMLMLMLV